MNTINWAQVAGGALAGLLVAVLLVDPIKAGRDRIIRRLRRGAKRLLSALSRHQVELKDVLAFGTVQTTWMVLDGDGRQSYLDVECTRVEPPLVLAPELADVKRTIEKEQAELKAGGHQWFWNGKQLALDSYTTERVGEEEKPLLRLRVRESDYYNFLATSLSLDRLLPGGLTVRSKFLRSPDWERPSASLSTAFGINVALVTSDLKVIVIRRGSRVGSMPRAYGTSINEGLNVADMTPTGVDVYACGRRGALEELGFDLPKQAIHFFSLGVDTALAQWGLLGIARTGQVTYNDIVSGRARGAKDKFEGDEIFSIEFTPQAVAAFVHEHAPWTPGGLACVYHALVNEYGKTYVEKVVTGTMARVVAARR